MSPADRPRVLMLTPQSPYPPHQGTTLRNYHLLRRLAQHAEVVLVTFVDAGQPSPLNTPLVDLCAHIHACPVPRRTWRQRWQQLWTSPLPDLAWRLHHPGMHQAVAHLAREPFDVVLVEGLEMAPYLFTFLEAWPGGPPPRRVLDEHNAEYVLQYRAFLADAPRPLRWHAALYSLVQWWKLRRYERRVLAQVDQVVAVSEVDRANLARLGTTAPITVVPNGVDVAHYARFPADQAVPMAAQAVVFTGKMDFRPNVDAVVWFVERVWPRVLAAMPDAHFYVVGRSPHRRVLAYEEMPGVFVTGEVADVRPYLWGATVYVAPLRVGGGTRLKLLEAMAARRAIVSTSLAAEGYPVVGGEHLLLADTAPAFADAIVTLLRDADLRERLGRAAQAFVQAHYDWDRLFPAFLKAVLGCEAGSP